VICAIALDVQNGVSPHILLELSALTWFVNSKREPLARRVITFDALIMIVRKVKGDLASFADQYATALDCRFEIVYK
jgi:hypothetical protein